ncbi:MAG TPA: iron-containing redox enzyme family protein [Solirubrobacterales bacterium]|nr:iron-containing redox enzyme family protein [Solirubrobacterales bacterium]
MAINGAEAVGVETVNGRGPQLPTPRGALSELLIATLSDPPPAHDEAGGLLAGQAGDGVLGEDFQLSLYLLYELHYRGFAGVDERWEWQPALLALRAELEADFEATLRERLPAGDGPADPTRLGDEINRLIDGDDGPQLSSYVERTADLDQFREFLIHRSAYQLKEADPHSWAIPRLEGPAKAALVEVQADEYGGGRPERVHATLFAKAMRALGLDPSYGAHLDRIPAVTLATVNLMSLFGLHRRLRGAIVGHLAAFETTSPIPNGRYAKGLRRLGLGEDALDFFDEHVEADSVHENIAVYDMAQALAIGEPALADDILFGVRALLDLDSRWAQHVLDSWERGGSSLLEPLASAR